MERRLRELRGSPAWRECSGHIQDAGFSHSAFWWRFSRPRTVAHAVASADEGADATAPEAAILTLRWKTLSRADLFVVARAGDGMRLIERQTAGDDRPRSIWPLMTGDYPAFRIAPHSVNPGEELEYYLRVQSRSLQRFPIELHSQESFQRLFNAETMIIWIFAGVIFTVVLLSVFFSIGLGERVYFYYGLYTVTYLLAIPAFIFVMIRLVVVQKQRNLIPFAVGWGLYYAMAIVHLMYFLGIAPYHPVSVFGMVLTLPVETIVFGGGLFMRYRALLRESARHEREKQIALRQLEELHNPRRYANSKLIGLDTDALLLRLNDLLERERIYRDETLTLKDLAAKLDINTHQLSELLNARLNVNFRRLLTNHRLKDAAALLSASSDRSVLEISLLVGFNSKTAFNVAFKQQYGVSPRQYRKKRSEL